MTPVQPPENIENGAPYAPTRWRTALSFVISLAILVGLGLGYRAIGRTSGKQENGLGHCLKAEYFAREGIGQLYESPHATTKPWKDAEKEYRRALTITPQLARARRGLAALLWLKGNRKGAAAVMKGPAKVPRERRDAWLATQAAFGDIEKPSDPAVLSKYRRALEVSELGWSRFVALQALAPSKLEASKVELRMRETTIRFGLTTVAGLAYMLSMGLGFILLVYVPWLRAPSKLVPLAAPPLTLFTACAAGLLAEGVPVVFLWKGLVRLSENGGISYYYAVLLATNIIGVLTAMAACSIVMRGAGDKLKSLGWGHSGVLLWGIGGYLASVPVLVMLGYVSKFAEKLLPVVETPINSVTWMVSTAQGWGLVAVFALVCVVGPLVEELIFRGFLFRALERSFGFWGGAFISSAVFASLHPQLPLGFLPILAIGMTMCIVYRGSGSLLACWLCHGINNAMTILFTLATYGWLRGF